MNTPEIEVIEPARPGRRRRFSAEEKRKILAESEMPGSSISLAGRRYGISTSLLFKWRRLMEEGTLSSLGSEERVVPESELKQLKAKVRELERMLGRKTMEVEILKEAVRIGREKKLISRQPLAGLDDFQ